MGPNYVPFCCCALETAGLILSWHSHSNDSQIFIAHMQILRCQLRNSVWSMLSRAHKYSTCNGTCIGFYGALKPVTQSLLYCLALTIWFIMVGQYCISPLSNLLCVCLHARICIVHKSRTVFCLSFNVGSTRKHAHKNVVWLTVQQLLQPTEQANHWQYIGMAFQWWWQSGSIWHLEHLCHHCLVCSSQLWIWCRNIAVGVLKLWLVLKAA